MLSVQDLREVESLLTTLLVAAARWKSRSAKARVIHQVERLYPKIESECQEREAARAVVRAEGR